MNKQHKFFLYARKSTDVEDKQVLSIEAQITELRAFAKQNNLDVVEEFVEKQSAKIPGRPIFGEMVKRIEYGEADGIGSSSKKGAIRLSKVQSVLLKTTEKGERLCPRSSVYSPWKVLW